MSNLLLKDGRYTVRIRSHLRKFVAKQKQPAVYINDLIEKEYKIGVDIAYDEESSKLPKDSE